MNIADSRFQQLYFTLACVFAAIIIMHSSNLAWTTFHESASAIMPYQHSPIPSQGQPRNLSHVFGATQTLRQANGSYFNLKLVGILQSDDPKSASVIIASPGDHGKVYHRGARLPGDLKIHEIGPDHIVLSGGTSPVKLHLPRRRG